MSISNSKLKIVMFPWFAYGHMIPYLQLANKLAQRGCKITFLLPKKTLDHMQQHNHHPDSITLHPLIIPAVHGLPHGAETASDIPFHMTGLLCTALDRTRPQFEDVIHQNKPTLVMHDFAYWIPEITRSLGIKVVNYNVVSAVARSRSSILEDYSPRDYGLIPEQELATTPEGYPITTIFLRPHEVSLFGLLQPGGEKISFYERLSMSSTRCDAMSFRGCYEVEGKLFDYVGSRYKKPVFVSGPVLPEPSNTPLEEKWDTWLSKFEKGLVVFCAFGSQQYIVKEQFQELCLGLELTGLPFLMTQKPPTGATTIEEALPEGFEDRVRGRGIVWGGWVQQEQILNHPAVGCFVSHCGFGSMWESLMSDCQLVLLPHIFDQILNARLMATELKVGVEVERDEKGRFSKENVCISIKKVMDKDDEFASTLRNNHAKLKDKLTAPGFMSGYIDRFVQSLEELVK
ncbi:hypothetical protein ACFE04_006426 [Oxalis oulophora]